MVHEINIVLAGWWIALVLVLILHFPDHWNICSCRSSIWWFQCKAPSKFGLFNWCHNLETYLITCSMLRTKYYTKTLHPLQTLILWMVLVLLLCLQLVCCNVCIIRVPFAVGWLKKQCKCREYCLIIYCAWTIVKDHLLHCELIIKLCLHIFVYSFFPFFTWCLSAQGRPSRDCFINI